MDPVRPDARSSTPAGIDAGQVRTASFEEVVSVCTSFTQDWMSGARPAIGEALARVGEDARATLLSNLLVIELERRRARGERPGVEEYLRQFPDHSTVVRGVFLQHAAGAGSSGGDTPATQRPAQAPAAGRLGGYQLVRELGRGGMGVVYEAVHLQRQDRVALKTLPAVDGAALHRFKNEFRALAGVNHPNLVGLHTLEADGCYWFFTMDLLEGEDFLAHVRPGGALDEARLRAALSQLATGVMALHARHVIHRDLKPSNVMVTREGRVVLLDFGLVVELDRAGNTQSLEKVAGTPRYMAPEQAAGRGVTPASDWYAVGVMLYEALAGVPPFAGPLVAMLHDKQARDAPPLPDTAGIPGDLAALCTRLLARDPRQRPDALGIARAAASGQPTPVATAAHPGQRLVGRGPQLEALAEALRGLERRREPQTVFISGRSGEGKSALAEHFLAPLRRDRRLAVMSGRCYDRESVPFKALDSLIDALAGHLRALPGEDAALLMPDDIGVLAQVFPVLQRVEVVAKASDTRSASLDEQQVRQRAFRALRSLLARIGRRTPVVWFVDDLQWGDADSAAALFEVLRPPEAPPVLFLGTYRSDETEGSTFLGAWRELQGKHGVGFNDREVRVGPLDEAECVQLVVGLVGKDDARVRLRADEFARETQGNPFLLVELAGCFDPDTDSFAAVPLHEVLARKLGQLPAEAGPLLDVVAVSGQALALEEAARAAGHTLPPMATVTRMRNERLVRLVGPDDRPLVDTYHDRIRETILDRLDGGRGKALHLKLAEIIEQDAGVAVDELVATLEGGESGAAKAPPRMYDLAYHFDAAGETRKALTYALLAAEQARRQSALEVAEQQYVIASRNAGEASAAVRYRIAEGYGAVLMLLGRYDQAHGQLAGAVDLKEDAESQARIETLLGEVAFKQGAINQSIGIYERGLRRLGNWVPSSLTGLAIGFLRESAVQCWHSLWPKRLHQYPPSTQLDLTIRIFSRVSVPYGFQNTLKVLWANLKGMNLVERLPPSPALAFSYAQHAMMMSLIGWHSRGARYGERCLELTRQFDDLWGRGHGCNWTGIGYWSSARYEEGLARLTEAAEAFAKAGDLWELHLARFHAGCCHYGLGDLAKAAEEARWTFASSARLGDSRVLCSSWLWARATRGDIPFEELKSCFPCRPEDILSSFHGLMAEGLWHSFHGRTAEALRAVEQAGRSAWDNRCMNFHTAAALPALAAALRLHAEAIKAQYPRQSGRLLRRAFRVAKWAARVTRFFPTAHPHSLRERSLTLASYGKKRKALKFADRSCAVAQRQKARYEYAQSLLVRARLAKELGLPGADEQVRDAETSLDEIERPVRAQAPSAPEV